MKRWRIGLFTECYRPIQNGIVASVDSLAQALCARGHDVVIVTPRMPGFDDDARNIVRLPSLPLPTRTAYRFTVPYFPGPDAFSLVHAHSPFMTGALAAWHAHRRHVPLVFTYHTQLEAYAHYVPFEAHATRAATALLTRTYANAADAVIVPTRSMERHLRTLGVEGTIAVIPSGIDVAAFARGRRSAELRARLGVAPHERMVLAVGRLEREKNFELVLEAFARAGVPAAHLVLVGDGTHREALERFARQAGIAANTTFAREFAREDLPDAYASADAFLFTSRSETQGLVLVEALAAGVPVVALDTPQTRDVLGDAGTLVEGNASACGVALRAIFERRPGTDGVAQARAWTYDAERCGDRIIELYASLAPKRPVLRRPAARSRQAEPI